MTDLDPPIQDTITSTSRSVALTARTRTDERYPLDDTDHVDNYGVTVRLEPRVGR